MFIDYQGFTKKTVEGKLQKSGICTLKLLNSQLQAELEVEKQGEVAERDLEYFADSAEAEDEAKVY